MWTDREKAIHGINTHTKTDRCARIQRFNVGCGRANKWVLGMSSIKGKEFKEESEYRLQMSSLDDDIEITLEYREKYLKLYLLRQSRHVLKAN